MERAAPPPAPGPGRLHLLQVLRLSEARGRGRTGAGLPPQPSLPAIRATALTYLEPLLHLRCPRCRRRFRYRRKVGGVVLDGGIYDLHDLSATYERLGEETPIRSLAMEHREEWQRRFGQTIQHLDSREGSNVGDDVRAIALVSEGSRELPLPLGGSISPATHRG